MQHKTFQIETLVKRGNGGRIAITTQAADRDNDHVITSGANTERYLANPVVQWGHLYHEPWQTVGRTTKLTIEPDRIIADFELRPAANEHDPQNIVKLLWSGGWVKTASIGFIPLRSEKNSLGGFSHLEWELLEWSLVPIPANPYAEALVGGATRHRHYRPRRADVTQEAVAGMQIASALLNDPITVRKMTTRQQLDIMDNWTKLAASALGVSLV